MESKYTYADFISIMNGNGNFLINEGLRYWLDTTGFFKAPASTEYHGAYEGGLLDHSIEVTKSLVALTRNNGLRWGRPVSPYIVGMFHDLCKIDAYIKTKFGYEHNPNTLMPGHGEKSVQLLAAYMELTYEEVLCIRWHMGAYEGQSTWGYYDRAIAEYPNVLWTHTADMVAAKIVGV